MKSSKNNDHSLALKRPVKLLIESFLAFAISSFCMAFFFSHLGKDWLIPGLFMIALYIFVLAALMIRVAKNMSIAALMLLTPIVPLVALLLIISLIPILEKLSL